MRFDCVVVGAGVEGSATALACAQHGKSTLLLEQHAIGHALGSSHGGSRITRYAYPEHKSTCTEMMFDAFAAWDALERSQNVKLFENVGLLWYEKEANGRLQETYQRMKKLKLNVELKKAQELAHKYPNLQFDDSFLCLIDHTAGVLRADRCLKALQDEFTKLGGTLKDQCKVIRIDPKSSYTTVFCENGAAFECDRLVVCAGAWAGEFCRQHLGLNLPLRVTL